MSDQDWPRAYADLLEKLPSFSRSAALALCGLNTCVDSVIAMSEAGALFDPRVPAGAKALADLLGFKAARGIGGEVRIDWPEGPGWLAEFLDFRTALGGTGAHAARVLTLCGVKALLTVADRSARQLSQIDGDILIAAGGRPVRAAEVKPNGLGRSDIFIFEYTAGRPFANINPNRSSRIIVRFTDPDLDRDAEFVEASTNLASQAGSAILSGFNAVAERHLHDALSWAQPLARVWRDSSIPITHLELAGYQTASARDTVFDSLIGLFNSIGMSQSEFTTLVGEGDLADGMVAVGQRLGVRRVCVHADHWAASATLDDPSIELDALMTGCLLSSARAATGYPLVPQGIPGNAIFHDHPFPIGTRRGSWALASCSTPYLGSPATTLGLGDTFLAGCLLVLGTRGPAGGGGHRVKKGPGRDD